MGIDNLDLSEVIAVSIDHPSKAPELLGKTFVTPWFRMDKDRAEAFEFGTYLGDFPHPYAGEDGYGEALTEGFHLLGMLDHICNHALWSEGPWIAWNYGIDKARFVSVVRWTDPLRIRGTIREVVDRGSQGHLLVVDAVGEVRDREQPGFIATFRVIWDAV